MLLSINFGVFETEVIMDYKKVAKDLTDAIGGKDNIVSATHCATRLRVIVRDQEKIDKKTVDNLDGVKGAFFNSGQYQVIFGTGTVNKVFEEVANLGYGDAVSTGAKDDKSAEEIRKEQMTGGNPIKKAIRTFGDVFVPIIPVLVATGLFMGLRGLLTQKTVLAAFGMTVESISPNFLLWTKVLTDTAFAFLPALVCWSTFRIFGGSPVIGIVLGLMLVSPSLPNAYDVAAEKAKAIMFFGFIPVVGYQGTVLPAFFTGIIGSKLEQYLRKKVPDTFSLLLTPFFVLLIMSVLSLFMIGPVFHSLEKVVLAATEVVLHLPMGLGGIIIGGLQQVIVVTGVHHIFNFLETQLLANYGVNAFNALISAATSAQAGATLAVGIKTKDEKLKALAFPSALSASLGITEPAIFGVNLRFVKPFVCGLVGGAVGGFLASVLNLAGTGMSVTVIPGMTLYIGNGQLFSYIFMLLVSCAVSFALTFTFGYSDKMLEEK